MADRRIHVATPIWALTAALAVLMAAPGCGRPRQSNLLLITTDTTRADHLGCYGYKRPTSPNLDALAAEAVRFERCFSHAPVTLPAHTSLLTGTYPVFHGIRDNGRFTVRDELVTLAELLHDRGWATAAFVSAFVLDSRFGLDQGFDTYDDEYSAEWSEENLRDAWIYTQMVTDRRADQTTRRVLSWLDDRSREPFFVWVHYYDPHQRYDPPHPYDQLFQDSPYDGEIAFMDAQIGRLFEALKERGLWRDTTVILTGDHGEGLGQHGETTHGVLAYDSTLRVPQIIKAPAASGIAPRVVGDPVSHVDIVPTVCELLGVAPPPGLHGASLVGRMRGGAAAEPASYFETNLPRLGFGWAPLFGIRSGGWKYIHAPRKELYDLSDDPDEIYNLAEAQPDRRQALEEELFSLVEASAPPSGEGGAPAVLDTESRRQLAALGYVGGGGTAGDDLNPRQPTGRTSPNDGGVYLADYYVANSLASHGRLREAARIFESTLLPLDPDNPTFLTALANLERRLGRPEQAFDLYRRAQAVDPGDPSILIRLGQLEVDRDRLADAETLFRGARELAPDDVSAAYLWARTAAQLGRPRDAIERYREVLDIDPSHRSTLINLGVELAKAGQLEEARSRLEEALEVSPFSARAYYNLGLLELQDGDPDSGAAAFERALRYRRPYPEARLGLAMALIEAGHRERARSELEGLIAKAPGSPAADQARSVLSSLTDDS